VRIREGPARPDRTAGVHTAPAGLSSRSGLRAPHDQRP
jgi:hypothetical protein